MNTTPTLARLEASAYTVPTEAPESDATLGWDRTTLIVAKLTTTDGVGGLGYVYGTPAMVPLIDQVLQPVTCGFPIEDPRGAWQKMVNAVRNLGRPGICSMAIAAVDIALWDALGRTKSQPLHRLLGGSCTAVPIYGSGGFTSYSDEQLVQQLASWAEQGIPRMKIKIGVDWGADPKEDLRRIALARRTIGDELELFIDANGAYDRTTAVRLGLAAFERSGVTWFEEPVSSDDLTGLREVREQLPIDVTAGEYGYHLAYFQQMLRHRAVDVLQADVGRCAGITEWLRVADAAAAAMTPISAHCGPTLHAAPASVPTNLRHLEYFHDHVRIDQLLFEGTPKQIGGELRLSDEPGLGLIFKESVAARYRTA